jgi:hypothetical protein
MGIQPIAQCTYGVIIILRGITHQVQLPRRDGTTVLDKSFSLQQAATVKVPIGRQYSIVFYLQHKTSAVAIFCPSHFRASKIKPKKVPYAIDTGTVWPQQSK